MFWVHFAILLFAIYVGIRVGGVGLGLIGGAGVTIFTFAFGMKPGSPPSMSCSSLSPLLPHRRHCMPQGD